MGLRNTVEKIKRTLLCCRKDGRKRSLDIVSLLLCKYNGTNHNTGIAHQRTAYGHHRGHTQSHRGRVRCLFASLLSPPSTWTKVETLAHPVRRFITLSLTSTSRRQLLREKSDCDAIGLLSLGSHPPTQPSTPTIHTALMANPFASAADRLPPSNPFASASDSTPISQRQSPAPTTPSPTSIRSAPRSSSLPLLNAASTNLPTTLPTPPHQRHHETSPPAYRIKSMWERTRRLSSSLSHHSSLRSSTGYRGLERAKSDGGVVMLDLSLGEGLDLKETLGGEADDNKSSFSDEGFETQGTVGGTPGAAKRALGNPVVERAIRATDLGDSSDSEVEERRPLVRV